MTQALTMEQMQAMVAQMQAENAKLQAALHASANRKLTMKVSEKGVVCVYGLGTRPVSLYASQWERLLPAADDILAFIKANAALVARKA